MMELRDASRIAGGGIRGAIYGDTRGRFNDGEYVITTPAKETSPGVWQTKNSTYRVTFAKAPVKAVWLPVSGEAAKYTAPESDAA